MKTIYLLPILLSIGCTVQGGKEVTSYPDGRVSSKSHYYGSVGSKAKGLSNSPEKSEILELDDSVSLRNVATAATVAYGAYASLAGTQSNNATTTAVAKSNNATKAAISKSNAAASVQKAKIASETTIATKTLKAAKP